MYMADDEDAAAAAARAEEEALEELRKRSKLPAKRRASKFELRREESFRTYKRGLMAKRRAKDKAKIKDSPFMEFHKMTGDLGKAGF